MSDTAGGMVLHPGTDNAWLHFCAAGQLQFNTLKDIWYGIKYSVAQTDQGYIHQSMC